MRAIDPFKAGMVLGALMGCWHFLWGVLVAVGAAQTLIDFVLWMHFIKPIYVVAPFNFWTAAVLIVATTIVGFALAFVFGLLWNRLHRI